VVNTLLLLRVDTNLRNAMLLHMFNWHSRSQRVFLHTAWHLRYNHALGFSQAWMDVVDFPCVLAMVLIRIFPERLVSPVIAHRERDRKLFELKPTQVTAKLTSLQSFHSQTEQLLYLHYSPIAISFRNTLPIDGHCELHVVTTLTTEPRY
jgi:hypothetical protein